MTALAPLASPTAYEPPIVTTLRRYVRRGAPPSLLQRLAGGPRDWSLLNETWDLDGRSWSALYRPTLLGDRTPVSADPMHRLSVPERRLMLLQLVEDYARGETLFPTDTALGEWFGVSHSTVANDIRALIVDGKLTGHLAAGNRNTGVRRVLRVAGSDYSTATPGVESWE